MRSFKVKRTEENKTGLPESPRRRHTVIGAFGRGPLPPDTRQVARRPVTARCALTPASSAPGRVVTHPPRAGTTLTALLVFRPSLANYGA